MVPAMQQILELLKTYFNYCRYEKNLSHLTIKAYKQDLQQFIDFIGENQSIDYITKEVIKDYVRKMFERKFKETTIKRKIVSIKAFMRYLEYEDCIQVSPFRKLNIQIRAPKRIPKYLSMHDAKSLFSCVKKDLNNLSPTESKSSTTQSPRNHFTSLQKVVIIELLFSTGIRVSELCNLNIEDIDLFKNIIKVGGKGSKDRSIVLTHPNLLETLSQFIQIRKVTDNPTSALLINRNNKRLQPHSVRSILKYLSSQANLQFKTTPHMFRHTIATLLLENGIDIRFVQKFLGHSSILTTQLYTHLSTEAERKMISTRHPRNFI
jgi:integrase/recombinase XerD